MTTTTNDEPSAATSGPPPTAATRARMSVRELVAELARVEEGLRRHPDHPLLVSEVRLLVRELRRRRALMRVQDRSARRADRAT